MAPNLGAIWGGLRLNTGMETPPHLQSGMKAPRESAKSRVRPDHRLSKTPHDPLGIWAGPFARVQYLETHWEIRQYSHIGIRFRQLSTV